MKIAIVIPVLNQLAYTQSCLGCLRDDLANGVKVIVVDNGSTDGSGDWLAVQSELTNIRNLENRGCAPAWNQGVTAAGDVDWTVVLNNDVLLPAGWLNLLLSAAELHGLDIVCPAMREREQNYDFTPYATEFMAKLSGAVRFRGAHGVCFAVRKKVFDRVGGFDEAFRIGQFEDSDFFRRARQAGFSTGIVGACFIHHFGSVTQDALSNRSGTRPYEAANREHFRKKWKLGWWRRRVEKIGANVLAWWWRTTELSLYGHTLHEKSGKNGVRYH